MGVWPYHAPMTLSTDELVAQGTVVAHRDGGLVFRPDGGNYQLHLQMDAPPPVGAFVRGRILTQGRKVLTLSAGGGFIVPIFGTPKVVQGRVAASEPAKLIIQCGCPFIVELPTQPSAFDLANGPVAVGKMVHVTLWPGARFELV